MLKLIEDMSVSARLKIDDGMQFSCCYSEVELFANAFRLIIFFLFLAEVFEYTIRDISQQMSR